MDGLVKELKVLQGSSIKARIDSRMAEFAAFRNEGDEKLFPELCFCLMTANFQAAKSIEIQKALQDKFHTMTEEEIAAALKQFGHRFPNTRAKFIFEARKHRDGLRSKLDSFASDAERRQWLAESVKGLGMKESSHFLRNVGYNDCAIIDFHIVDKLAASGAIEAPKSKAITPKRYLEIEQVLKELGGRSGLNQAQLDLYLWFAETGKILK